MSINLKSPVFAGNPIRSKTPKSTDPFSPTPAFETLKILISNQTHIQDSSSLTFKILPFRKGRPLAGSTGDLLTTLMVATDWADEKIMGQLAIAGHARALLEWYSTSRFCGSCGEKLIPIEAGRRKQCINTSCKKRIYPRVDPVVIMLVIDKENDRVLLSKQSRFVPRMWSCLSGFIEPGESLEEAVRRETWEETGIEVGEVVYHSSQPWPVGSSSMPCQLMVGFFAYATSVDINVDKKELEDAEWHSREDVKRALTMTEYGKAQKTAASKVDQICKGVEKGQNLAADFGVESGELQPMFVPGPFAIAHHLISSWAHQV
ncbi:putative NAD(+) diphosphatase [Helianthus debilis subsp. tardiflorus]